MSTELQFCTFVVDGQYFGVEVLQVQEVIRYQEMTRVPLASRTIRGLINLRGQIVTAIDLRRRLELPDPVEGHRCMNVVVRTSDGVVSLLVDEIGDVLNVDAETFESTPQTLTGAAREMITGIYKLKDRLMLVMDIEKTVNVAGLAA